ncbi:Gfo/Idh/MocA family oxidoreductase [Acidobacteria bacterium AH-259-O06]|nr:Gfo/Idh/MocA family oxidoreductase [Acidobacteria bacterium AH-259-O06]
MNDKQFLLPQRHREDKDGSAQKKIMLNRRDLLRTAAGAVAMSAASYAQVPGANDRINLGVIGCGGRGLRVMQIFQKNAAIRVSGVCDIWGRRIEEARHKAPGSSGFADHRKLLEMNDLDVILIGTPDHWHAQIAIDAISAGKDVYIEKPLTLRIEEGPEIVKAARVNKRICQVGMQQRSGHHYLRAKQEYMGTGKLGKIMLTRTWWNGNRAHLRKAPAALATKPADLDWARYLGPLKWRDYDPQQYYNFRAYLDFGGGLVTDLFAHWIDVIHMFIGEEIPRSAVAAGGIYQYKDGRTAPDTINVLLEYPGEWTATFEATLAPGTRGSGVELIGTEGRLLIDRRHFEFQSAETGASPVIVKAQGNLTEDHVENFLKCVHTRRLPTGDVLIGHRSAQACHLGNLAYLQKRRLQFDPIREEILPL